MSVAALYKTRNMVGYLVQQLGPETKRCKKVIRPRESEVEGHFVFD